MESETSWTAVIALVLSVIAIIFIIVVVYLFSVSNSTLIDRLDDWILRDSGTTGTAVTPESFVATPNTILNVSGNIPAGYHVAINNYSGISSVVVNGRTTIFKIANNKSAAQDVTVVAGSGVTILAGTVPNPLLVTHGTTATYMWISPTSVQRIE